MPKDPKIKKVLVLGSGPIVIGQAAEFDYAGTQACRALKEEGVEGLRYKNGNVYTVQVHPEASPGPKDTEYLFDRFIRRMEGGAW